MPIEPASVPLPILDVQRTQGSKDKKKKDGKDKKGKKEKKDKRSKEQSTCDSNKRQRKVSNHHP